MEEKIREKLAAGDIAGARNLLSRENGTLLPKVFNDFDRRITLSTSFGRGAIGGSATGSRNIPSKRAQQGRR